MAKARDALAVGGILLLFKWVADWRFRHPGPSEWFAFDANDRLGAEYDEIARAIRAGRGFSDSFRVPTGPTAWMAPVMPSVLAAIYWASGDDREIVVEVVLVVKCFVLLLTGLIVTGEARRIGRAWLRHAVFVLGVTAHFHGMFQRTHDERLLLLVMDLIWLGSVHWWWPPGTMPAAAAWGTLGGFARSAIRWRERHGLSSPASAGRRQFHSACWLGPRSFEESSRWQSPLAVRW